MKERESSKADMRRVVSVVDRKFAATLYCGVRNERWRPVAEFHISYYNLRYKVISIGILGREMRKPSGRTDPDRPVGRRQKRIGITILPDEPLAAAIMTPLSVGQNISSGICSHPDRAVRSSSNEIRFAGVESVALIKMLGSQRFSLQLNPRDPVRKEIGDPDCAIGGLRYTEHGVMPETVSGLVTTPDPVLQAQQPARSGYPYMAMPIPDGLVERLVRARSRKANLLKMKVGLALPSVAGRFPQWRTAKYHTTGRYPKAVFAIN